MPLPKLACVTGFASLLLLAGAGPAYQLQMLPLPAAFALIKVAAYAGGLVIATGVAAAVVSIQGRTLVGLILSTLAVLSGIVSLVVPYRLQQHTRQTPPIHDLTTDLDHPPVFATIVMAPPPVLHGRHGVDDRATRQREDYPDIAPVTIPIPADEAFEEALELVQENEWQVVDADSDTGRIEASATSDWFGFRDDIVVRLTPAGTGTRVDVRSVSRVGRADVGTNVGAIREFLAELAED